MKNRPYDEFTSFEELFEQAEQRLDYHVEGAKNDFTEKLVNRMKAIGMNRTELAEKLGKEKPQITRLLCGKNNFTIKTMVKIASALDCTFTSTLEPKETKAIGFKNTLSGIAANDYVWSSNNDMTLNEDELEKNYDAFASAA
jgi:transcriptional regulator with XRE-family HTH domain